MAWTWESSQVEDWATSADFVCDVPAGTDPALIAEAMHVASSTLWALSGRQYGYRTVKIRPALQGCFIRTWLAWRYYGWNAFGPMSWTGQWPGGWMPTDDCFSLENPSCSGRKFLKLRHEAMPGLAPAPVGPVFEVKIDGVVFTHWTLVQNWYLERTDGNDWPTCQDLSKPDTEDDTFSVTYRWGSPPPPLAKQAVSALACELVKLQLDLNCELPSRIQSVSRQGVSFTLIDPMEFLDKGRTGLYLVDLFLATYNPLGFRRPSGVFRADKW